MVYKITFDSFTKINEQAGTIQNVGDYIIEMSESPTFDSGILILPNQKSTFNNTDIYLRCIEQGFSSEVRIVPFILDAKGGDVSSVDTTALKSVALVGNALNFYTSSDTAQAAAYSIDIPAEQFLDQAATSFVPNFYFSAILYPNAINPNLNGKPVFVLGVKTKSNDGQSSSTKYSFIDVSNLVDTYVASDTSVTVSDYKIKVNISPDEGNALKLKANGLYADGVTDTATASSLGLTKLYGTTGANTDGTITQAAITANLNSKLDSDAKAVSATTADKLSTARSLKVNLSSTSATTFDGSANVTIGVGGILPVANGGTGNANGTVSGAAQLNTSRNFITNLNSTSAGSFNGTASVSAGVTGTLPVSNGGTGQSNLDNVTVGAATKAYKDSVGNVITDTYVTKSELSHKLGAVRYGYRIKKDEADPDLRVEYLYDAAGMRPAHMVFDTDTTTAGTDSDTSYFDYGDWQSIWFVRDNKPLMLKYDGTVSYYLNPNDYTKKIDGTASDATNTDTALYAMVQFPLVWIYRYEDDDYLYEIVSNVQWDDNYKAYAHTDYQGVIKPFFYLSPDFCTNTDPFKSILGQNTGGSNLTTAQMFQRATAIGNGWHLLSWSQVQLLRSFMMLISKSTNSKHFNNTKLTYSADKLTSGQFRDKIFHCWFGWTRVAGVNSSNYNVYVKMTPEGGYRPNDVNGYVKLFYNPTMGNTMFIKEMTCNQYGMYLKTLGGSSSTFFDNYTVTLSPNFQTMQFCNFQLFHFWNGTGANPGFKCSLSYV